MIVFVLCLTLVSAYTVEDSYVSGVSNFPPDTAFGRFISNSFFSAHSISLGCTDLTTSVVEWTAVNTKTIKVKAGEAILINWWRGSPYDGKYKDHPDDSRQFMKEIYLDGGTTGNSVQITCDSGAYWNKDCYYDIYTCAPATSTTTIPIVKDPDIEAQMYGFSFGDINGNPITSVNPGDQIQITFYVKSTRDWNIFLNNQELYGEVGIVPYNVAEQWGIDSPYGLFATFKQGDEVNNNIFNECCDLQENIQGGKKIGWSSAIHDNAIKVTGIINVPSETTQDMCGYGVDFYNTNTTNYVVYASIKNGCSKDGYTKGRYIAKDVTVNIDLEIISAGTGTLLEGQRCSENYQCASGICEKPSFLKPKVCVSGLAGTDSVSTNLKVQKSIDPNKIRSTTSKDLLKSSCTTTDMCEEGSFCKTIDSLVEDGYLTKSEATQKLKTSQTILLSGAGGAAGVGACVAAASALSISTAGTAGIVAFPLCAVAGGSVGYALSSLLASIETGRGDKYGYCVPESGGTLDNLFKWAAFFDIDGNGIKDGFDGLIVFIAALVLLTILFRMGGRR